MTFSGRKIEDENLVIKYFRYFLMTLQIFIDETSLKFRVDSFKSDWTTVNLILISCTKSVKRAKFSFNSFVKQNYSSETFKAEWVFFCKFLFLFVKNTFSVSLILMFFNKMKNCLYDKISQGFKTLLAFATIFEIYFDFLKKLVKINKLLIFFYKISKINFTPYD